jgi:NADH-quinone oxidoreductase subunit M
MDLLTGITFLPLATGLLLLLGSRLPDQVWRWVALAGTTATFLLSLRLWAGFDPAQGGYQFVHHVPWIPSTASTGSSASTA